MTILDQIIENKKVELFRAKEKISLEELKASEHFNRKTNSLKSNLLSSNSTGIIAEYKRKSPSKGEINMGAGIVETTEGYTKAGAAGISVLTDTVYFGGFKEDLFLARANNPNTPLLRKDFMIDEYQIYEAKAWGADVILLIAANLEAEEIANLSKKAHELGLEVLLEVHDKAEIDKSPMENVDIIGVNNRNLKNFAENNVNASLELFDFIPIDKIKISESCISHPDTVKQLRKVGYQGFLMGENFMKTNNPAGALEEFVSLING
ncbi:indole-3-glycerol phosphate synthase TrpC [Lacihabitans sp. LS3-19]|uniref:indole-3-glycerol phosphate synthase TrpC n=1 Tax=Lacihabitans sp. LS3-19 TaxID=2487335 RepID=UPI0020CEBCF9|nr:indole-3-glycerol phosphate synthase TrpC [Lacihabitans sp. LS3-19]MCP9769162.1 indole-3-glycerol phosphate synthase TrpC [Lacihabitans sp. LS3-19]